MLELERFFSAFSDKTRLQIVFLLLTKGEVAVDDISKELRKPQSLVSHHLSYLKGCGIVRVRKNGKYSYYSIDSEDTKKLIDLSVKIVKNHSQSILSCEVLDKEFSKDFINDRKDHFT